MEIGLQIFQVMEVSISKKKKKKVMEVSARIAHSIKTIRAGWLYLQEKKVQG